MGYFSKLRKKVAKMVNGGDTIDITSLGDDEIFRSLMATFGKHLRVGESDTLRWNFADGISGDIVEDVTGCGCTNKSWDSDGVTAVFTNNRDGLSKEGELISMSLTVYLKDGISKVPNAGRGGMMWPPEKRRVRIEFSGWIKE